MQLPKVNLKEIDFKQFFLKRGEWVGLGVALLIVLPLLYSGISRAFSSGSPDTNARTINDLAKNVEQHLKNDKAPAELANPPAEAELALNTEPVDPSKFSTDFPWFVPSGLEDTKRREPAVLPPTDFIAEVVRGGVLGNIFIKGDKSLRVGVLKEKQASPRPGARRNRLSMFSQYMGGRGPMGMTGERPDLRSGPMGQGPGLPGSMPGMPGGMPGMPGRSGFQGPPGMYGQGAGMVGPGGGLTKTDLDWADLDKVEQQNDVRLALQMYPARMIVVTGTFPFKEQLEQFRVALHKRSLNELVQQVGTPEVPWQFKGFEIERRDYGPDGKPLGDWQDFTKQIEDAAVKVLAVVPDKAPEDPKLQAYEGIINRGLVMALPPLARGEYPNQTPPSLQATLKALDEASKEHNVKPPPTLFMTKAKGGGINVWDPVETFTQEEEKKEEESAAKPPPEPGKSQGSDEADGPEPIIPKDVLIRFYDRNIEPGHSYEYRVKVRMANPNHGPGMKRRVVFAALTKPEEILSADWAVVPKIKVPYDVECYVMDNHADRRTLECQIHRWVDSVITNPNEERTTAIGDWVIWDKAPMRRGEYLGGRNDAKVPKWATEKEDFELARNTATHSRRVPVDFTVETQRKYDPALLVDYLGGVYGNVTYDKRTISDEEPVQVLVLTPEGKLIVRNSADDRNDETRKKRFDKIKEEVAEAERPKVRAGAMAPSGLFDRGGMKGGR
jgi:hypothetical protein